MDLDNRLLKTQISMQLLKKIENIYNEACSKSSNFLAIPIVQLVRENEKNKEI
jgi:hypothetical protein